MSTDRPTAYRIFLLTFWLAETGDLSEPERWRFRLEEPKQGRRHGYLGVTALAAGLTRLIGDAVPGEDVDVEKGAL